MSTATLDRPAVRSLAVNGGTPVSATPIPMISIPITEDDVQAVVGVLRSGMLAQGKNCLALEQKFAQASGAKHALTCANGTCALQLAYEPLFEPGDEVLVPAWTYVATVSMVVARGGIPVFCDVDPQTYNIDPVDAKRRITKRTAAIACTHLYGNPVDIDAIEALAIDGSLSTIYDAAQAHLSTYKGRGIGSFGDAVTYSFYATKNMTTGEGGMITTNDDDLAAEIKLLRSHGETQKYIHGRVGYNYRMTDMEGALGLSQFARLPGYNAQRRATAATFDKALANIPGLHAPTQTAGAESIYHLYVVRVDPAAFVSNADGTPIRDTICKALNAEGVPTAIHYPRPVTRQPAFEHLVKDFPPVADRLASTLFCIPIHQGLTERQVSQITEALAKVGAAYRA